ncbi:hypothetical protein JCM19238_2448 [Vibrio ponticus]|nr:hypothetical protein JCM19238_2448 [Vibrio ponticus]
MKSPCIAVCKNNHGICSGCLRTMEEITGWRYLPETEQISKINQIRQLTLLILALTVVKTAFAR